MEEIELTVLMPCYNHAETLPNCIISARSFLMQVKIPGEIIVADLGSVDGSQEIAHVQGVKVLDIYHKDYGAAVKEGIKRAHGRFVIVADPNGYYDFYDLHPFIAKLKQDYAIVVGNRFNSSKYKVPFKTRFIDGPISKLIGLLFFANSVGDYRCAMRGYNKSAVLALAAKSNSIEFNSEVLIKASMAKVAMTEVPILVHPEYQEPKSRLPWREDWRNFRSLLGTRYGGA
jgi:glycosyltransferase involved in cell wall biosynthesis